jgi:tRNA 2-thiouridine synthesizing protein A
VQNATQTIDTSGMVCPHVAIAVKARLATMGMHEVLRVIADDPMAAIDVPAMAHEHGHVVIGIAPAGSGHEIRIEVRSTESRSDLWPFSILNADQQ